MSPRYIGGYLSLATKMLARGRIQLALDSGVMLLTHIRSSARWITWGSGENG